jgi:hypothetical protein
MRTKSDLVALAAVVSVLPAAAAAAHSDASATPRRRSFVLAFHDAPDLARKARASGTSESSPTRCLDAQRRKVGHDAGVCTFTTLTLPEAAARSRSSSRKVRSQRSSNARHLARSRRRRRTGAYRGAGRRRHCRSVQADRHDTFG